MRIAIVIPGFQSDPSDWCIPAFTNLARELAELADVHVFALRYPARRDEYSIGRIRVTSLGAGALGRFRIFGFSLMKLWRDFQSAFQAQHQQTPFDVIVGIWATESGWLAASLAQRLQLPSVVHIAGGELVNLSYIQYGNKGQGLAGVLVPQALHAATLVTVPSEPVLRALLRQAGKRLVREKAVEWRPGVDTEMFAPWPRPRESSEPFTFVNVGSLLPVKGQRLLVEAMARLRRRLKEGPDVRLRIYGEGHRRRDLEMEIEANKLEGYVTLEGEVRHENLPAAYSGAHAFALSSHYEAQCMAVLEALSCGVPWVGPPVGALPDLAAVDAGEKPSGFLFDSRKAGMVAASMQAMVQLPDEERRMMGEAGRNRILRDYDMKTQARKLHAILQDLTRRGHLQYHRQ